MAWTNPRTWVAGEVVTAALLNAHLRDNLNEISGWTAYSPTLTGITVGNGTLVAAYANVRETIHFHLQLTFGSTTTLAAGSNTIGLPVATATGLSPTFTGDAWDSSAGGSILVRTTSASATTATLLVPAASAGGYDRVLTSTVPFTWATGDRIYVAGTYQRG